MNNIGGLQLPHCPPVVTALLLWVPMTRLLAKRGQNTVRVPHMKENWIAYKMGGQTLPMGLPFIIVFICLETVFQCFPIIFSTHCCLGLGKSLKNSVLIMRKMSNMKSWGNDMWKSGWSVAVEFFDFLEFVRSFFCFFLNIDILTRLDRIDCHWWSH